MSSPPAPAEASQQEKSSPAAFRIQVVSFGFKHGPPDGLNLLFDVRFLPNPFYVPELKPFSGMEPQVASYVLENEAGREFLEMLAPLLSSLIPRYQQSGAADQLRIGIGCTGGKHRSVAVAEAMKKILSPSAAPIAVTHRDLGKE